MVKKPTIKDVAQRAGVSIATVSFVLNNRPGQVISERVKKRVWRAAEQLKYHPSAAAAGLARKRTHNVAIIFYREENQISNQFYSFVVQGAVKEAIRRQYNLLFSYLPHEYAGYSDLPKVIREKNAEGAIFVQHVDERLVRDIEARGIPVVAIDNFPHISKLNSLQIDNRRGGQLAAEHLLELGHQHLAFLYSGLDRPSIAERAEGFEGAIVQRGLSYSVRNNLIECSAFTFEAGYEEMLRVFARKRRPTGLLCANDEIAAGALRAAHELGLSVPRDVSVVGFDNISMSAYTDPPLTTVAVDKEALGSRAMDRLLELVEQDGRASVPIKEIVPVELVVRQSTSRPPSKQAK